MRRTPAHLTPPSALERTLRGRLLGRSIQLIDGRVGVLASVWYNPGEKTLACLVQLAGVAIWVDADEVVIPPGTGA